MRYFLLRILKLVPIILGVTLITFSLIFLSPSDPAKMHFHSLGVNYTDEMLESFREENGLNDTYINQYLRWGKNFINGDLGKSYSDGVDIKTKIMHSLPYTLYLTVNSMLLTLIISIPVGLFVAYKTNSLFSNFVNHVSLFLISLPNFVVGLALIYLLSIKLKILPVISSDPSVGIIMPTITLALAMAPKYIRQIRSITEKELDKDYIYGLRTRGISELRIMTCTVLKNISVEILTLVGASIGSLMGGVTIVETIFNWRGIGKLIVEAVLDRDIPMIQGIVVWMAIAYVFVNLFTDLSYGLFDPRIRLGD